jgi:hypothetical protein
VWIEQLAPWADRYQVKAPAFTQLCGRILSIGKADPKKVTLSHWTVQKALDEARIGASLLVKLKEYGKNKCLHFDEVRVTLGRNQGNPDGKTKTAHIAISVTGTDGEQKLGVAVSPNGRGKT